MENDSINDTLLCGTDSGSKSIEETVHKSNTQNNKKKEDFKQQKMIKQFAQTLICIVLICIVSFFKDAMKHEKLKKKEMAEIQAKIAHQNYMLERERFLEKHHDFLQSFLEYEDHCNKIHPLIIKHPGCVYEVKSRTNNCKRCNHYVQQHTRKIVPGDRAPLDFALIYVFFAILLFLFVRAVVDVSKEFNAPHSESTEKLSLHDYASISSCNSRRNSNINSTQKHGPKLSRLSFSMSCDPHQGTACDSNNKTSSPGGGKRSSFSSPVDRRCSLSGNIAHHLLKDTIDEMGRRPSVESFTEEDQLCSGNTIETNNKKHKRLIRR